MTIEQIGEKAGLKGKRLELYVKYVNIRFPGRPESYLTEWANRFAQGIEYGASDFVGQTLLDELSPSPRLSSNLV